VVRYDGVTFLGLSHGDLAYSPLEFTLWARARPARLDGNGYLNHLSLTNWSFSARITGQLKSISKKFRSKGIECSCSG